MKSMLCNTQVVQNILAGRQTQDRRPITPQPATASLAKIEQEMKYPDSNIKSKYQPGDIIYVRERAKCIDIHYHSRTSKLFKDTYLFRYEADDSYSDMIELPYRIKHIEVGNCCSNGCFKELARIFLKVTKVRVERIQDISEADAKEEGIISFLDQGRRWHRNYLTGKYFYGYGKYKDSFQSLWDSIYPGSWERNDWVFVYDFEKCEKP